MLSELPRYTWHARRFPCKNVLILTDEPDERAFLFRIQIGTHAELLGRIARHKVNKLSLSCRFELQGRIMLRSWFLQWSHVHWINIVFVIFQSLCGTNRLCVGCITSLALLSDFTAPVNR